MDRKPSTKNVIGDTIESYARAVVKKMSDKEVLATLKAQDISSLEDLVAKSLKHLKETPLSGGLVARDTFIYTQAVYKIAMPVDKELISQLAKKIGK